MTSKKGKKIMSREGYFSFDPKNGITHLGFTNIRINLRSASGSAQPFSTERGNETVFNEALNLKGQIRLLRTPRDAIQPSKDLLKVPVGLVTRLRAKKFKEAFNGLLQDT